MNSLDNQNPTIFFLLEYSKTCLEDLVLLSHTLRWISKLAHDIYFMWKFLTGTWRFREIYIK